MTVRRNTSLRWGILGVSELVGRRAVLPALQKSPKSEIVAIASRDLDRARTEAQLFDVPRAYGSYAELLDDTDVEAVYIPLPNSLHAEWATEALDAGLHVLCEKPLACTADEASHMAAAAARSGTTLMEAYMTPFHARSQSVVELAKAGALGDLRSLRAVFTFPARDADNYRWLPEMGGGALLDVGVYCLDPMLAIAGDPLEVAAKQVLSPKGVDATFTGWLTFINDVAGSLLVSFEAPEDQRLEIVGTKARLVIKTAFTAGQDDCWIDITHSDGRVERINAGGNDSYLAMVEHFVDIVREEAVPRRPPAASIRMLTLIDRLRVAATT